MNRFEKLVNSNETLCFENSIYKDKYTKIQVTCKNCGFTMNRLLQDYLRVPCTSCAKELRKKEKITQYIKELNRIHKNWDFSKVRESYTTLKGKVEVTCDKGHNIHPYIANLLKGQGCGKCSGKGKAEGKTDKFLKDCSAVHGDRYDYLENYANNSQIMKIRCKEHNQVFTQRASDHRVGKTGCKSCELDKRKSHRPNPMNRTKALRGDFNYPMYTYLVRIFNDSESFYKVGVTKDIGKRFSSRYTNMGDTYSYEILTSRWFENGNLSVLLEQEILTLVQDYAYTPQVKIRGYTECFMMGSEDLNEILLILNERNIQYSTYSGS